MGSLCWNCSTRVIKSGVCQASFEYAETKVTHVSLPFQLFTEASFFFLPTRPSARVAAAPPALAAFGPSGARHGLFFKTIPIPQAAEGYANHWAMTRWLEFRRFHPHIAVQLCASR